MFGLSPATGPAALMPAHLFQPGPFTVAQRAAAYANRWRLYSCLGALTGLFSYVITGALGSDSAAMVRRLLAVTNLLLYLRLRLLSSRCPIAGGRRWSAACTSVSQQTRDISSSRAQSWCYIARFRSPWLSLPPFCCVLLTTALAASRGLHLLVHCSKFSKHRLEPFFSPEQEWWPVAAAQPVGRGQCCRKAPPSDSAAQGGADAIICSTCPLAKAAGRQQRVHAAQWPRRRKPTGQKRWTAIILRAASRLLCCA